MKNNLLSIKSIKIKNIIFGNVAWFLFIVLGIVANFVNPVFFTYDNIINFLVHTVTLGFITLALSICLITGNTNLTVEAHMIISVTLGGWLLSSSSHASGLQLNPYLVIFLVFLFGALIGAFNGFLVAYLKMNSFITTLALSIVYRGIVIFITKGTTIYPLNDTFNFLGRYEIRGIPLNIFIFFIVIIFFVFFLSRTSFGRFIYAVGSNKYAAEASGVNVRLTILLAYILSGVICGFSGLILAGRMNAVSVLLSKDVILYAISAAILGGISRSGGKGNLISMLGGVLLIQAISNVMSVMKINPMFFNIFTGGIILFSMLFDTLRKGKTRFDI